MERQTYTELIVRDGQYVEVESMREPGSLELVEQRETGNVYELHDWRMAIAEMNRKNAEREAERQK